MPRRTVGYIKLEWTCPNCGTRNPGPQKACTNCGAPQPENVQFETGPDQELIKDQQAIRAARAGPDFICPYCGTRNRGDAKVCTQCGGDLVEAKRRAAGAELQRSTGPKEVTCTNCGTVNPAANINCLKCGAPLPRPASIPSGVAASAGSANGPKKKSNWPLLAGIGAALLVCCAAVLFLFVLPTVSVPASVADVTWQTSVPLQQIQAVNYSNEPGSPPSDAYNVSCHTESHEVCEEKTIDRGNGYAEVVQDCHTETDDYCSYTVDEWQTIQTYSLEGHDYSPDYSQPSITSGQRLGNESVTYTVFFDTAKGGKTYSPGSLSEFQQFTIGSTWTLKLNALGAVLSVGR